MPQLNLYIDQETLAKIEKAAKREHKSLSGWVRNRLAKIFERQWPEDYFQLFGSLSNEKLERPKQINFLKDSRRLGL
jgi:hypothetical protein